MAAVPPTTPSMVCQDPIRVTIRITAPIRHSSADVSPIEPGMKPMKASHHWVEPIWPSVCGPSAVARASQVAPEKPSTPTKSAAIQGLSPEISAG